MPPTAEIKQIIAKTEADTIKAAQDLSQSLKADDIILLSGTLGMGKTVFARALIRALVGEPSLEVVSPTFTLMQSYNAPLGDIHHYDLYRLEDYEEILNIGWEDSLSSALTIVEWPERLGPYRPASALDITIKPTDNDSNAREILITRN